MPKIPGKSDTSGTSALALSPFWASPGGDGVLYLGDVVDVLRRLPSRSVHCCITSPPYHGLRDYGTAVWEGGDPICDHLERNYLDIGKSSTLQFGNVSPENQAFKARERQYRNVCSKCGARRIDNQIGLEPLHDCGTQGKAQCGKCFVCSMVRVFSEVYRVLRDDGSLWLNLGDTYDNGEQKMVPVRVALALEANRWKLIQDIIWHSPNKMPESVTRRCAKSYEHIFLMSKGDSYYFDHNAIRVDAASRPHAPGRVDNLRKGIGGGGNIDDPDKIWAADGRANKRDVWIVPTVPYKDCHYATFSSRLIEPCILAGTSEYGCCAKCGKLYERLVSREGGVPTEEIADRDHTLPRNRNGIGGNLDGTPATRNTIGWRPTCLCRADVVPCTVLDPFVGSGTTVATSIELGRRGIGIDLSEEYLRNHAILRIENVISARTVREMKGVVVESVPEAETTDSGVDLL